jgi:hypothetical protein
MNGYESPKVIDLGSIESLTRASGDDVSWDSNLGIFGFLGFAGNGGSHGSAG